MLPTADAAIVSAELAARFGLPLWQFTVSATDANRHVIRYSRMITGRSKIVVIDRCYHGSVDETFATLTHLETQWPAKEILEHLLHLIRQRA
jgi:glutamate-1-semialdehyde 2,1-aminomutase